MKCNYTSQECPFSECDWSKINWCKQCKVGSEQRFLHRRAVFLAGQIKKAVLLGKNIKRQGGRIPACSTCGSRLSTQIIEGEQKYFCPKHGQQGSYILLYEVIIDRKEREQNV